MKKTIILTGARAPVAVDLARSFCTAGYETHLADSVTPWAARCLRPRVPIYRLASPRHTFPEFRRDLVKLVEQLDPTWIIPTCEEVFWLSEAAARDGYSDRVFAPSLPLLRRLHSKFDFAELARSGGVLVPDTWVVSSPEELTEVPLSASEMVLKPEFSRFSTETIIRPNSGEIRRVVPSEARRWVAQRFIEGIEVCSWAAVRDGTVVAFTAYRPIWRHGRAAIAFAAVHLHSVAEVSRRIAAVTDMTGHLSLDLIVTPEGSAIPIECNPRATSGVHLMDADPTMAAAIVGEGIAPIPPEGRLRYLGPAMIFLGIPSPFVPAQMRAFLRDLRRGGDVIGRSGDRLPVLGALADAVRFAAMGLVDRRSMAGQTTEDIEWNGEKIG
ncbi:MAG: hypothetical protein H7145_09820 [Akkermansiaceae bacterium]|nr:hypothetical protein [Armatimonadota bacterium]